MLVLHYTGMEDSTAAVKRLCRARHRRFGALCRAGGRPHHAMRAGSAPRLARRTRLLGRRDRHQFVLDRYRDRQSRTRPRLSGFSSPSDRGRDGLVPQHLDPPPHPGRPRARPFRRLADTQARSGREISLAHSASIRHRVVGEAGADRAERAALRARRHERGGRRGASAVGALRLCRRQLELSRQRHPRRGGGLPAPLPPGAKSTACSTARRSRRLKALLAARERCDARE